MSNNDKNKKDQTRIRWLMIRKLREYMKQKVSTTKYKKCMLYSAPVRASIIR